MTETKRKLTRRGRGSAGMRVHRDRASNLTLEELEHNRMAKVVIGVTYLVVLVCCLAMELTILDGPPEWFWATLSWSGWIAFRAMDWLWPG